MNGHDTAPLPSLWFGLTLPLRAAALILRHPRLLGASLLPWLLSVGLDAWLIHRVQTGLGDWIHAHVPAGYAWAVTLILWVALVIAGVVAFTFIAGIVALPFNDWLAEQTESRATPPLPPTARTSWSGKARLLSIDLFKTLCALFFGMLGLALTWVPGLNLVGIVLEFLVIAFQFLSYPQTRRGEGAWAGAQFVVRHFWACLGFGVSFAFLFALPLISSLALPLAVVGGTLLYARGAHSRLSTNLQK